MPRKNELQVPKYRLHKPFGQAAARLNGRDFYLGAFESQASCEKYDRLVPEWLANARKLPSNTPMTALSVIELIPSPIKLRANYNLVAERP